MPIDPKLRILLVEDSQVMGQAEVKILNDLGLPEVTVVFDGQEAIDLLATDRPVDLVISDWNMPRKDGFELLTWIRSEPRRANLPFIMATAQGEKRQVARAMEAGATELVSKPFSSGELRLKIEAATDPQAIKEKASASRRETPLTAEGKARFRVAHIQITDHLTLGVLKHLLATEQVRAESFDLETVCLPSWNPVQEALEEATVDAAFVLAPIAMDLYSYGVPLKLVLLAHKNGSIMVRRRVAEVKQVKADFFRGGTFFIPHRLSIHHMLAHRFFSDLGLRPGVPGGEDGVNLTFEVVPPIKMPEFLSKSPEARGFMVAEPIGTRAIAAGVADLQFLSGQAWPDHPCCVVVFRAEVLVERPVAVQEFVSLLVESGRFISGQPDKAAEIALDFLDPKRTIGLTKSVLKNVLTEPQGITTDDLYPVIEDLDKIQRYMSQQMGIGQIIDLESFVDLRFADQACPTGPKAARPERTITADLALADSSRATKSMLDKEGKYLTFHLAGQEYGIDVLKVKEIIGLAPITPVPRTPAYVKGVFNLRGKVIPVVDLRLKFDLEAVDYTDRTCIVVLETAGHAGAIQVGAVVDSVAEVSHIPATEIEEAPTFGVAVDTRYIMAMAKISQGVKILLDIDRVVGQEGGLALEA